MGPSPEFLVHTDSWSSPGAQLERMHPSEQAASCKQRTSLSTYVLHRTARTHAFVPQARFRLICVHSLKEDHEVLKAHLEQLESYSRCGLRHSFGGDARVGLERILREQLGSFSG